MQPHELLTEGFSLWLEEYTGKFRPVTEPEPFGTSLRSTRYIFGWLQETRDGKLLSASSDRRRQQAITDMKHMGLLSRDRGDSSITAFGLSVLGSWERHGLSNSDSDAQDIARGAHLLRTALDWQDPHVRLMYGRIFNAWCRLSQLPEPSYWIEPDRHRLFLPYYLSRPDPRGYNPFAVVVALSHGKIGPTEAWKDWANDDWTGAAGLSDLLDTITGRHRPGGSLNFRKAMEVVRIARTQSTSLPRLLEDWKVAS